MKYKVKFTELAHAEADFAFKWIEQSSPVNAAEWFNGLVDAVESLCSMPERCVLAFESEDISQEIGQLLFPAVMRRWRRTGKMHSNLSTESFAKK